MRLLLLLLTLLCPPLAHPALGQRGRAGADADDAGHDDDARAIAYTIRPVARGGGRLVLEVELEFRGGDRGESTLTLPSSWGGRERLYESIRELRVVAPRGATLRDTGRPWVKRVTYPRAAGGGDAPVVRVTYEVVQTWSGDAGSRESGERERLYRPMLERDYFHVFGSGVFVRTTAESGRVVPVTLRWRGVPDDWSVINSHGVVAAPGERGEREQRFRASPSELDYSVFVGGDFRVHRLRTEGGPLYVAVRGTWKFTDEALLDVLGRVVRAEREFWEDRDFPYYLVTMIPTGERGGGSLGGTGLTNSFALYAYDDVPLGIELKRTIAHEMFHAWNPARLAARSDGYERHRWFGEGVTEFYTRLLLLRAGLITADEYLADYNERLHDYYTSPSRTATEERASRAFFSESRLAQLPYQRGDVLAHRWNARIREATGGRSSLDDVMRALLRRARDHDSLFTADVLAAAVRRYTRPLGHDPRADITRYVERGELVPADSGALGPCARLRDVPFGPFDLGFDAASLARTAQVRRVDRESNAYAAGLRDGQRVRSIAYTDNLATRPVRITVVDSAGAERTLEFLPQGEPRVLVPQYELRGGCTPAELRRGLL